jgi:hypothetical protein
MSEEDWEAFVALQRAVQQQTPHGTVTMAHAFRLCVSSTSAALARGDLVVGLSAPPLLRPPGGDQAA